MNIIRNKRGITLIELLVALGLVGMLTMTAYMIMSTGMKAYNTSFKQAENQGVLRAAMLSLSTSMHAADTVKLSGATLIMGDETVSLQGTSLIATKASGATRTIAMGINEFTLSSNGTMVTITLKTIQGTLTNTLTSSVHIKPY